MEQLKDEDERPKYMDYMLAAHGAALGREIVKLFPPTSTEHKGANPQWSGDPGDTGYLDSRLVIMTDEQFREYANKVRDAAHRRGYAMGEASGRKDEKARIAELLGVDS